MFLQNQNNNNNNGNKNGVLPKFYPGNASLNKNADGLICSINTTQANVTLSRTESRLEYYRNQKPQAAPQNTGLGFGQQSATQPSLFGQQPATQQPSMFGQQQQPQQQPSLFGTNQQQQQTTGLGFGGGLGLGSQQQTGLGASGQGFGTGLGTGLGQGLQGGFGASTTGLGTGFGLGGQLGQPQQQTGLGLGFGQQQQQQTGLLGQAQPQQQTSLFGGAQPGLGLGGMGQTQPQQQQGLFGQQPQQQPQFGAQQTPMAYPQYPTPTPMYPQQGEYNPAYPYPQHIDIDFDIKNEQEYLKEIEDEFRRKIPTFSQYANESEMTFSVGNVNLKFKNNPQVEIKIKPKQVKTKTREDYKPYYACAPLEKQQKQQTKSEINRKMYENLKNQQREDSPIQKKSEIQQQEICPRAPQCNNYQLTPPIQQLQTMKDIQLARVRDFKIANQYGTIHFLEAVDLRDLNIDKIVDLKQDTVEFYPDGEFGSIPEYGKGLNVRCKVVLKNFACENRKMCELRISNKKEFEKLVRNWTEKNKMKFISAGDDVVFELDQL